MAFELPLQVFWEDTDAGGIVYHANYLRFFERARTSWLRALGIGQRSLKERTGGMFVVSSCTLQYLRPARIDDELVANVMLQTVGRAQLALAQQVRRHNADGSSDLLCEGTVRLAWVDAAAWRPTRIPEDLIEKMRS
ncbi:MAG: tol-pal system-associated acyl-CoA thioesterase [Burkholderiaceae bacterium]|nr:tol-pal system-associated acyl-CoA thioesterase [Burkholderiaceae bacterium]